MSEDTTAELVAVRTGQHGEFLENSRATWALMDVLERERNWPTLKPEDKHALYMIMHKAARIVCGDPSYADHWDDIAGYARVRSERLKSPTKVHDPDHISSVLARAWRVSPEEAKERFVVLTRAAQEARAERAAAAAADDAAEQMKQDLLRSVQSDEEGAAEEQEAEASVRTTTLHTGERRTFTVPAGWIAERDPHSRYTGWITNLESGERRNALS